MESPKVRHDWVTYFHFTSLHAIVIRIYLIPEMCVLSAANWPLPSALTIYLYNDSDAYIYTHILYICSFSDSFPLKVITKY